MILTEAYEAGQQAFLEKLAKEPSAVGEHWADYAAATLGGAGIGAIHSGEKGALIGAAAAPIALGSLKLMEQIRKRSYELRGDRSDGYKVFKSQKKSHA